MIERGLARLGVYVLPLLLVASFSHAASVQLLNSAISVVITDGSLESLSAADNTPLLSFASDSWLVELSPGSFPGQDKLTLSPTTCELVSSSPSPAKNNVTYHYECPYQSPPNQLPINLYVDVTFDLPTPQAQFVSKQLAVSSSRPWSLTAGAFFLHNVILFDNTTIACAGSDCDGKSPDWQILTNPYYAAHIAGFARFTSASRGAFVTVSNPFFMLSTPSSASCTQGLNHVGDDLPGSPTANDASTCQSLCKARDDCAGYVYLPQGCEGASSQLCFLKSTVDSTSSEACPCLGRKPFLASSTEPELSFRASYHPQMAHNGSFATHAHFTDRGIVGLTSLSKYHFSSSGINLGEKEAFSDCVNVYLLDWQGRTEKTVKVNVAWDENDYQIDVATSDGLEEYSRIFARNAELGVTHIVFEPQDSDFSSRFNTSDGWGWEGSLWFSLGESIREGGWNPVTDDPPQKILDLVHMAQNAGVQPLAYVYPCLPFEQVADHVIDGAVDLSPPEVQQWAIDLLSTFLTKTGAAGYSWDHDIFAGPENLRYAQWRAWMNILAALRAQHPDIVMDHRQTNHAWGPWYQLAGSYAEPIAGDENPESYGVPVTSLHTDHVAANNLRIVNLVYATQQLQPPVRMPGFIFHQTERTADNGTNPCFGNVPECFDSNIRDFDLMGYKYSLLSSIGTAGLNNVVTMIPARDLSEYQLLPKSDLNFIRQWLQWTDANIPCLLNLHPIPSLSFPLTTAVDGTACGTGTEAYVFLFNAGMLQRSVDLVCDESIGLGRTGPQGETWNVVQEYPAQGSVVGTWVRDQKYTVSLFGGDAVVLHLTRAGTVQSNKGLVDRKNVLLPESSVLLHNLNGVVGPMGGHSLLHTVTQQQRSDVVVNGVVCDWNNNNNNNTMAEVVDTKAVEVAVSFEGPAVYRSMPISPSAIAPSTFQGGWFNTSFVIPSVIAQQLQNRSAAYPIQWAANEYDVSWLVPHRLLMVPFVSQPQPSMQVSLWIDGQPVDLKPAYNSRALKHDWCFMGWFFDASNLQVDVEHQVSVSLPSMQPFQFQGIFWENIETIWTQNVKSCSARVV